MKSNNEKKKEQESLLTFLTRTKDGKYAKVEKSSQKYARMKIKREIIPATSDYYYSVR
ncbi:MAG: hypothetical protein GF307_03140 [candidate division Zixibacteria bacterium]|nr:hypothetical protein [candidate division Zixibacteria bacterium]